jgi:hypothetical protein
MNTFNAMDTNATHVWKFYARKTRAARVATRRAANATARARGFRNAAEMEG